MPPRTKTIRLCIFNEEFWSKGLVYSQNILPLITLREQSQGLNIEIIGFISFLSLFISRRSIRTFEKEMLAHGIKVQIFPTLYIPSRFFYPRWFMIPFLIVNTAPYIWYLKLYDFVRHDGNIWFQLRSYEVAFAFNFLYRGRRHLVFDPRTDFLEELTGIGIWTKNSMSYRFWLHQEERLLTLATKTIFISDTMKEDILSRHGICDQPDKYFVFYNQADFSHFESALNKKYQNFLYTGSLGNWNNISNYLNFFKQLAPYFPDSSLYIVTLTNPSKFQATLLDSEFDEIRSRVKLVRDLTYAELPRIYADCKYGLQLMSHSDSRVGVKYVEYIAAGILPIINSNVRGAVDFSTRFSIGIIAPGPGKSVDQEFCDAIKAAHLAQFPVGPAIRAEINLKESTSTLKTIFN
jgi:glycosyltransferase involved in cell wall biosynthesis